MPTTASPWKVVGWVFLLKELADKQCRSCKTFHGFLCDTAVPFQAPNTNIELASQRKWFVLGFHVACDLEHLIREEEVGGAESMFGCILICSNFSGGGRIIILSMCQIVHRPQYTVLPYFFGFRSAASRSVLSMSSMQKRRQSIAALDQLGRNKLLHFCIVAVNVSPMVVCGFGV